MKNRSLTGLSALIALSAFAQAQTADGSPPKGVDNVQIELNSWRAEHGDSWQIKFDDATGYARFLYGGNAAPMFTPHSDADFLVLARQAARDTYKLHGIEVSTLVDDEVMFIPLSNAGSSDKMTVQFRQFVHGVPVEGGFLNVLFDRAGRVLSVDTTAVPDVANMLTTAAVSSDRASQIVLGHFFADSGVAATDLTRPELVIFKDTSGELLRPVVCWKAEAQFVSEEGTAKGYRYFIDANTGRQIARFDAVMSFDVSGTVTSFASPGTKPDEPSNVSVALPMPNMTITSPQGNAVSDANGNFNIVGATAPVTATFKYLGPDANVLNSSGAVYTLATPLNSASGNNVVMNSPAVATVTPQANALNWISKMHNWLRAINPADTKPNFVAVANVNIASSCNAFYNGTSTNFYLAGGGCVNTGYADVVVHENGHWMNDKYSSGNGSDGFGEGNADNFALYLTDQPTLGADFQGVGTFIRTGTNTRQFCGDASPGCYGEVHNDGEVLMGACWKVRVNLKNSLGASAGAAAADNLFSAWMNVYNDTQIKTIIETHWLTLDDNDGNIGNGTPNFTAIEGGFRQQGFPQIALAAVSITNVTNLPDTLNTIGPYTVNADVVPLLNPPITVVQLKYRVNGGSFSTVAMSLVGGNTYTGSIPGQPCPNTVEYYVSGTNNAAQTAVFPSTAPATNLDFVVGTQVTAFNDNFQTDQGWTATFAGATAGFWQRGVPVNDPAWAYDPASDGDGSGQCYLTQNILGNSDVDGGSVTLTSPVIDMSATSFTLSYKYYLYITVAAATDFLRLEANNNGGVGAWTVLANHTVNNSLNWTTVSITRAQMVAGGFTPSANSMLRFTAADGGTASIVESGVDAVNISSIGGCAPPCPTPVVYCTAKVNSLTCVPAIFYSGQASATAPTGFAVFADGERNQKPGLLLYTTGGRDAAPFQGGFLCVASPIKRSIALNSGGNALPANDCSGSYLIDMNEFARGTLGGTPLAALSVQGTIVQAQMWGRDQGFPAPNNSSLSDALEYTVCQ